ncbi:MAG: hypothetical protein NTU76_01090 [Candidatus Taylorbacteria bacterium]|nr:hypothetical protein [Candidatus Taylorbacteria bacterium]
MKKLVKKKPENKLIKSLSIDNARRIAINSIGWNNYCAENKLEKLAKQLTEAYNKGEEIAQGELAKNLDFVSLAFSLDSGHTLMESVGERHRGLALQLKKEFEKEFDCKSSSEKALIDMLVSSYITKMTDLKRLESNKQSEFLSHEMNGFLSLLSKDADRAHRQFISTIETLKSIKQPALNVNVKTNNAFIGENQQFNQNNEPK